MKKWKLLSITVLTLLLLTGCQNTSGSAGTTENTGTQKEQQVTSLTKNDEKFTNTTDSADSSASSTETNDSGEFYGDTLDSLEEMVNEIVQKINNADASGSDNKKYETFIQLNDELREIENQLDYYEENTENDFEQGRLSYDEARKLEFDIEKLEDKLDDAEDTLEYKFGYDD